MANNTNAELLSALRGAINRPRRGPKKGATLPEASLNAVAPYRFKAGEVVPGRGVRPKDHARSALNRLASTSPPPHVCAAIGVDPESTWIEALVYALAMMGLQGDVPAIREILTNFGLRGSVESVVTHTEVQVMTAEIVSGMLGRGASDTEMREYAAKAMALEANPDVGEVN